MDREFLITFNCAAGDIVAATAFLRDLTHQHPVRVGFQTNHPAVVVHTPRLVPTVALRNPEKITLDYSLQLHAAKRGWFTGHFVEAFYDDWFRQTGMRVRCTDVRPAVYLTEAESASPPPVAGPYWLLLAGGKTDMTVKHWSFTRYEELVRRMREHGLKTVQTGAEQDVHPDCGADVDLVGLGGLRDFIRQVAFARGVIGPVTCAMHLAAAFHKPYICIGGGRESAGSAAYPEHVYLNTVGKLDCCQTNGCWRSQAYPPSTGDQICLKPEKEVFQILPACMKMITVDEVLAAVLATR